MSILLDGTGGVTTPGVVNTAGETIATTLSVTGATNLAVSSGNVGIGVASPTFKLHIASSAVTATYIAGAAVSCNSNLFTGTSSYNYGGIGVLTGDNTASGDVFMLGYTPGSGTASTPVVCWTSTGLLKFNSGYGSAATAYGCRAWVNFNGTGTPTIRASGNVSSITDVGVGDYTVNFTTAMVDTNYTVVTSAGRSSAADYGATTTDTPGSTTSINYSSWQNATPTRGDVPFNALTIFR